MTPPDESGTTPGELARRAVLALVVVGALAVSIGGQVAAVEPKMGGLAVVLALTNDLGAVLALNEALSAPRGSSIRRWAWLAILLAAGTAGALNTWHIVAPAGSVLPVAFGWLVGLEPIALVLVLSHLMGLVLAESRQVRQARQVVTVAELVEERQVPRQVAPAVAGIAHQVSAAPASGVVQEQRQVEPASPPPVPETPSGPPGEFEIARAAHLVSSARKAGKRYGRGSLARDMGVKDHVAKELLAEIDRRDLAKAGA